MQYIAVPLCDLADIKWSSYLWQHSTVPSLHELQEGRWILTNAAWSIGRDDAESPSISFVMAGGYTHPQRGPLTEQWDCITVASKKSDPFDYLQSPLLKLFFINGLQEEDQWVVLLITFPYLPSLRFTVNYFVLPDGHCCVASYKIFKTWPSSAKYFTSA